MMGEIDLLAALSLDNRHLVCLCPEIIIYRYRRGF